MTVSVICYLLALYLYYSSLKIPESVLCYLYVYTTLGDELLWKQPESRK